MKKQNILKKISLLVLSSIMLTTGVLATPGETVAQSKHDKNPAYPKLTTKDAGKNPTTKKKTSSGGKFIGTAFATIGVLWTINKTHDLISALFGNPYFKIGMMIALSETYQQPTSLRGSLLSPGRDLIYILRHFQREPILIVPAPEQKKDSTSLEQNLETLTPSYQRADTQSNEIYNTTEHVNLETRPADNIESIEHSTQKTLPIFKGIVSKMTDDEIQTLMEEGKTFAEYNPVLSKLLLKRFDVLLIDAFESAAEKISSLFSPKSEYDF